MKNGWIFHSYVSHNQRVNDLSVELDPPHHCLSQPGLARFSSRNLCVWLFPNGFCLLEATDSSVYIESYIYIQYIYIIHVYIYMYIEVRTLCLYMYYIYIYYIYYILYIYQLYYILHLQYLWKRQAPGWTLVDPVVSQGGSFAWHDTWSSHWWCNNLPLVGNIMVNIIMVNIIW